MCEDGPRSISVVIPAFNEEQFIGQCLDATSQTLTDMGLAHELVVVDDGSSDHTAAVAHRAGRTIPGVRVLQLPRNEGKGSALSHGAVAADHELVAFVDADLEIHPRQLRTLYEAMVASGADAVIGSKHHPSASFGFGAIRRFLSSTYSRIVEIAFRLPVHDTQTGLKLFRAAALRDVLARTTVQRFAWDLEVLLGLSRSGYQIIEVPVTVTRARPKQRIRPADVMRMAWDTALIWWRDWRSR